MCLSLPWTAALQTLGQMLSLPQSEMEVFLTEIYRAVGGAAYLMDKVQHSSGRQN